MGDNGYDSVMGGIVYYFGQDASLMDRHRKQDPESALFDLLQAVESSCVQQNVQVTLKTLGPIAACNIVIELPPG